MRRLTTRRLTVFVPLTAALFVAGCNENARPIAATPAPPAPQAGANLSGLPQGAGCTQAINNYQSIIQHDSDTGNVNQSVYVEIEGEISRAAEACRAGRDGEARTLIQGSKSRHGYHG